MVLKISEENKKVEKSRKTIEKNRKKVFSFFYFAFLIILFACILILHPFSLSFGSSMEPTIPENCIVYSLPFCGTPKTGEIYMLQIEDGQKKTMVTKRVVGVPGDYIEVKKEGVFINGKKLEETYVKDGISFVNDDSFIELISKDDNLTCVIPNDYIYVMGDNRSVSLDSRYYGIIPINNIKAKVIGYSEYSGFISGVVLFFAFIFLMEKIRKK